MSLGRLRQLLATTENIALLVVVIGLIGSVLLQVISRYAIGSYLSLAWTDEVARALVAWLTFLGAVLLDRDQEHITVTIITDLLGARTRSFMGIFTDVMCILFLAVVLNSAIGTLKADGNSTMVSLPLPVTVVSASLAVGALLMLFHVLDRLCRRVVRLRQPEVR